MQKTLIYYETLTQTTCKNIVCGIQSSILEREREKIKFGGMNYVLCRECIRES